MAFWSGQALLRHKNVASDFDAAKIDCNAYTLSMGDRYYRTPDAPDKPQTKVVLKPGENFAIPAGQFAFLLTKETVKVPANAIGFISVKTGIKFQGLINVSGFHVDPGYEGKLIFAVYNAGPSPIHLQEGEPAFKIWLSSLDEESEEGYLFDKAPITDIGSDIIKGMSREILSLQSMSEQLRQNQHDLKEKLAELKPHIDNFTTIWRSIMIGLTGAVVGAVLLGGWAWFRPSAQVSPPAPQIIILPSPPVSQGTALPPQLSPKGPDAKK